MTAIARREVDWAVVAALPLEIRCLARRLRALRVASRPGLWAARAGSTECALITTGVGAERAELQARDIFRELRPRRALVCGFGGGLGSALETGDVVLANRVVDVASGCVFPSDGGLLERAAGSGFPRLHRGPIATTSEIASDADSKRKLARATHALCVDLESAGVARALAEIDCPAVFARVVVDVLETPLPKEFKRMLAPDGSASLLGIASILVSRPWLLPALVDLGRRSGRAARELANFACTVLDGDGGS